MKYDYFVGKFISLFYWHFVDFLSILHPAFSSSLSSTSLTIHHVVHSTCRLKFSLFCFVSCLFLFGSYPWIVYVRACVWERFHLPPPLSSLTVIPQLFLIGEFRNDDKIMQSCCHWKNNAYLSSFPSYFISDKTWPLTIQVSDLHEASSGIVWTYGCESAGGMQLA